MQKEIKNATQEYFTSGGYVIGRLWGGGLGAYRSREYNADSIENLKNKIKHDFESGGLDSGAGFEKLLAARIYITTRKTIEIDDDKFYSTQDEIYTLGDETLFDKFDLF